MRLSNNESYSTTLLIQSRLFPKLYRSDRPALAAVRPVRSVQFRNNATDGTLMRLSMSV